MTFAAAPARADHRHRWGGRVRVHVGGGGSFVWRGPRYHYRPWRWHRPYRYYSPRVVVGGSVWLGTGYYFSDPPPPAPPPCDYPSVPSYYTPSPPPPAVDAVVVAPSEPRFRPRVGVGVMGGRMETEDGRDGDDLGVFARLQATRHFGFELEIGKTEHDAGDRVDKRIGGAMLLDVSPRSRFGLYLLAGAGRERAQAGSYSIDRTYGEIGAGLVFRVTERFHLATDLRIGAADADDAQLTPLATAGTASIVLPISNEEHYNRGRLSAILYF